MVKLKKISLFGKNCLTETRVIFYIFKRFKNQLKTLAEVAELVDALGSGSSRRTPVGVRVPSSAPSLESGQVFNNWPAFFLNGMHQGAVD
jgi:hypothetical protein